MADAGCLHLRELRTELGWTQQQMADRIARLAWMRGEKNVGVNGDMVAQWERGVKGVSPRYRELLCILFGVTADQLGLGPATRSGTTPRNAPRVADESLVSLLDNAAQLLDQLGATGTLLAPQMLQAW
ncbi:MAG TPA: helix-turn-helix transcriptional regulator [Mycobacteriales bacterium]|nr:helix-turn-helix transcriptional regulator [Mycobacteriales bacterium]